MELQDVTQASDPQADVARYDALRATNYALLGALLAKPPAAELLADLATTEIEGTADSPLDVAWRALGKVAATADPEALVDEYQELFIGIGRGELLPYASWYLTGFLNEQPLTVLRDDLARLGFAREEGVSEPEDHVGALCEVMAMLIADPERTADYATQRNFYTTHIGPYVARFWNDLEQAETARFYRAVSQLGAAFTDLETKYFSLPE